MAAVHDRISSRLRGGRRAHPDFPVTTASEISRHYSRGDLLARLEARLREDGFDPARPTFEALAPYDHFHGRGLEATEDMANLLEASGTDHLLDVGSGIGGPARYMARRFGCRVSGIDLTAEFCEVARHLTSLLGLEGGDHGQHWTRAEGASRGAVGGALPKGGVTEHWHGPRTSSLASPILARKTLCRNGCSGSRASRPGQANP